MTVYNNDGPGFGNDFLQRQEYLEIRGRIRSFIPESSIVGVLMEHDEYTTIKSSDKIVMQHDPFSWSVLGKKLVRADDRSRSGKSRERISQRAQKTEDRHADTRLYALSVS